VKEVRKLANVAGIVIVLVHHCTKPTPTTPSSEGQNSG